MAYKLRICEEKEEDILLRKQKLVYLIINQHISLITYSIN